MIEPAVQSTLFFKCLADLTRLRATLLIQAHGELCVCDLMTALQDSQPKISRHLAQLRNCQILQDERRGQWVFYRLHRDLPDWALQVIQQVQQAEQTWLAQAQQHFSPLNKC